MRVSSHRAGFFLQGVLLLFFLVFLRNSAICEILPDQYLQNGGYIVSQDGEIIAAHREKELFVAASTFKLLTVLAILDTLGTEYRFTTSLYLDQNQVLYIKGTGDPFLTSEVLAQVAIALRKLGIQRLSALVLDDSSFQLEQTHPEGSANTENPYDAPNGALAVNFNSVAVTKNADGTILPGEPQSPLTKLTEEISQYLPPGSHRVNVDAFPLVDTIPIPLRYTGELLQALLARESIHLAGIFRQGTTPASANLIYSLNSPSTVQQMVTACLQHSNNYIANQLALAAGAKRYGLPATWQKAQRLLENYAREQLGLAAEALQVSEGSGLSHRNRMSPAAMLVVLDHFAPYKALLPEKHGALVKSGTMADIYCYAGYLDTPAGESYFAIFLNQERNHRDKLLISLQQALQNKHFSLHQDPGRDGK